MSLATTLEPSEVEAPVAHETLLGEALDRIIAKSRTEIPPITHEMFKSLSALDTYELATDRLNHKRAVAMIDVMGVLAGVKPAMFNALSEFGPEEDQTEFIQAVNGLGLEAKVGESPWGRKRVIISRHPELVDALEAALDQVDRGGTPIKDSEQREGHDLLRKIGILVGYPKTATEYFLRCLSTDDTSSLPPKIAESRNTKHGKHFVGLILSPENYDKEMEQYVEPLEAAVYVLAPETYKQVVYDERRRKNGAAILNQINN